MWYKLEERNAMDAHVKWRGCVPRKDAHLQLIYKAIDAIVARAEEEIALGLCRKLKVELWTRIRGWLDKQAAEVKEGREPTEYRYMVYGKAWAEIVEEQTEAAKAARDAAAAALQEGDE